MFGETLLIRVTQIADLASRILAGLVVVSALCCGVNNTLLSDAGDRAHLIEGELRNLSVINDNISHRNATLASKIQAMRTDERVVEQLAREELGMIRTDETIFLFPPEFENQFASAELHSSH